MAREFRSEIPSLPQVQVNDSSKATEISQSRPVGSVARQARRTEDVGVVSRTVSHGEKELGKHVTFTGIIAKVVVRASVLVTVKFLWQFKLFVVLIYNTHVQSISYYW